jgi:D-serine deaminase-like pyridoxal phosphate-dependent protein
MFDEIPTPFILIDAQTVRRNLDQLASYAKSHRIGLRPHTKTHKSKRIARMQIERGAVGLTVAKVGEAMVMADETDDLLMAYPALHPARCAQLAALARDRKVRVAVDSSVAADALADAARSAGATIGILVELDVGHHRNGVQNAQDAVALAQQVDRTDGLRLDGLMFYPGHISHGPPGTIENGLQAVSSKLAEVLDAWHRNGLEAKIVSGGSTPAGRLSHLIPQLTEFRPGTYVFNDVNCIRQGCATIEDCAARIICTVISTAVPGQFVIDAGSKTLTSDRCGPAPESGHGMILEYPNAKIAKLSEEHGHVDATACERRPKVGERVTVIPNHICPCINLQDNVWWHEPGSAPEPMSVDARGKVY